MTIVRTPSKLNAGSSSSSPPSMSRTSSVGRTARCASANGRTGTATVNDDARACDSSVDDAQNASWTCNCASPRQLPSMQISSVGATSFAR